MNRLIAAHGSYDLARFPADPRDTLRAWDASDEYLLRQLDGSAALDGTPAEPVDLSGEVVVVGDRWGALAVALAGHRPVQVSDSYLAQQATRASLARNGIDPGAVRLLSTQDEPPARIDVLLVRVPKSLALLEDQLHRLAPAVHAGTVVIGTGMTTEIHTSTLKLFERIIGPTRTSLAVRKARLIHCTPDPALKPGPSPWPHSYELPGDVAGGLSVTNHAGVFSAERLDIGTRLLLQHLPQLSGPTRAVDLGCGNGVVGTAVAALAGPGTEAEVVFADESHQAIASAQATFAANGPHPDAQAEFLIGDGLSGLPPGSVDLVLNNPPFHSHQATTDAIARRMFAGARATLRPGGELRVVGNRHLGYHVMLRRLFGNCTTVASNPKFVVLSAIKK
ncbi:methyltransferase [Streptacidiphilus carbonis]|uniref:methyltransferase n=1 Tax=Streptacidiphilus carbonis TaxID=105422 RepID=UPI0005A60356|nr:methyltransferase [Streptacidiphilus carbonis]